MVAQRIVFFVRQINKTSPLLVFCFQKTISSNPPIEIFRFFPNWHSRAIGVTWNPSCQKWPQLMWTKIFLSLRVCIVVFGRTYDVISARHVLAAVTPQLCFEDNGRRYLCDPTVLCKFTPCHGQMGSRLSNHKVCLFPHISFCTQFLLTRNASSLGASTLHPC